MKILYIVSAYPREPGDVITPWLVETIHRLGERGVDVEVLAPAYRGAPSGEIEGVRVHRFRYAPARWETLTHDQTAPDRIRERPHFLGLVPSYVAAGSLAAARLGRSGGFDAVHAFWPIPHGVLGLWAKRTTGVPLVSTFFGVELTWMERDLPFLAPLLRRIVRSSDAVTAISTYTADRLRKVVPGADPVIIPFGAAVNPPGSVAASPAPESDALELLFVGRLVERKGVHVLLDAVARVAPGRSVLLHLVGEGPARVALEERASKLGIDDRVRFHGFVSKDDLARRFRQCDVFVLPAVVDAKGDTEGLGVVLLEAMGYGKPVIASAAGGILDIVQNEESGLLVPPGDASALASAIARMADDPESRRLLGARGRETLRSFSWARITTELESLYRNVSSRR